MRISAENDPDLRDEDIVRRVLAGEGELFERLLRRYNRRLGRVARSVLRNEGDAEEVVQETWLRAFANLRQLADPTRFAAWISRIALYEAWARARRDRRRPMEEGSGAPPVSCPADPERAASDSETVRLVEAAIDALPEKYRLALVLRGIEGLTAGEAARHLKISRVTVNTRFHRARALLRSELVAREMPCPGAFQSSVTAPAHAPFRDRGRSAAGPERREGENGERGLGGASRGPFPDPCGRSVSERARSSAS